MERIYTCNTIIVKWTRTRDTDQYIYHPVTNHKTEACNGNMVAFLTTSMFKGDFIANIDN